MPNGDTSRQKTLRYQQTARSALNRAASRRPAASVCRASQADRAVLERAGSCQAADRSRIDGIGPSHISHRLARVKPLQRFLALMSSHLAGAPKFHASILGTLAALACPGADHLAAQGARATATTSMAGTPPRRLRGRGG